MNNDMISIEEGFQYSINISYDLHNEKKLNSFIPTNASLKLIREVVLSTNKNSTDRARVLVGAYGKGKSHIVLTILSLLEGTPVEKFAKLNAKIQGTKLEQLLKNYQTSKNRLLPVLITGNSNSISQNFLLALQRTLSENNLLNLLPETNFKAAEKTILKWKSTYPKTYKEFENKISCSGEEFISQLQDFDNDAYKLFEDIYPELTSGGSFNPFLGFDVTEVYESVVKSLCESNCAYSGIYVVYDEFSKYLEANIAETSSNDMKMLQDFAEKCNRSGSRQMHLMLICHKEISNYIDSLPKQKVDGWHGISERFTHVHLNNNFSQTYEIIESAIVKNKKLYEKFIQNNKSNFENLVKIYKNDLTFSDLSEEEIQKTFTGCYPLHPVSIFILPRLSELVAQNERTLFTFLSSSGANGLKAFLEKQKTAGKQNEFNLLTPDILYDYFEPLLKKEVYTDGLYKLYTLTNVLLEKLNSDSLEAKIIKTLSLIYILSQFERLAPTATTLHHIFDKSNTTEELESALDNLIKKECIVYLKRSNNFYSLKQTSGIDINAQIQQEKGKRSNLFSLKEILAACNYDKAFYPLRYNDEKEITRYFSFVFIDAAEITKDVDWNIKSSTFRGDGVVYGILPSLKITREQIIENLNETKSSSGKCIFILPKKFNSVQKNIIEYAKEYDAVKELIKKTDDDNVLHDEYEVILSDLQEIILNFIGLYTQSEKENAFYIYNGEKIKIKRKADVTEKLSKICFEFYSDTPKIINESVNKNEISTAAENARNKIVSSLLRIELEKNLGLSGGQELAVMRSLLLKTNVLDIRTDDLKINLNPPDKNLSKVFELIQKFLFSARNKENIDFSILYKELTTDKKRIGLRKGLIPVYLACVLHEYKKQVSIYRGINEVALSADVLSEINKEPQNYTIKFMDWTQKEDEYINSLMHLFSNYIHESKKENTTYETVFNGIRNWYMNLPKYSKEMKVDFEGRKVPKEYSDLLKNIKSATNIQDFIFKKLRIFKSVQDLEKAKVFYDTLISNATNLFAKKVSEIFCSGKNLCDALSVWSSGLMSEVFETVYADGTERFLRICASAKNNTKNYSSVARQIAYVSTDLQIEDWNDSTLENSLKAILGFKKNAESKNTITHKSSEPGIRSSNIDENQFEINYVTEKGVQKTKRFEKSQKTPRAKILSRSLKSSLDGMGLSVTDAEKRQVLMELLLGLCGENV